MAPSNILVVQTEGDSVLLSTKKSIQSSRLTRSTHRNLFSNDKDSNETVTFITSQTLRNTAANKKRQCKIKWGQVRAIMCPFKLLSRWLTWTLFTYTCMFVHLVNMSNQESMPYVFIVRLQYLFYLLKQKYCCLSFALYVWFKLCD